MQQSINEIKWDQIYQSKRWKQSIFVNCCLLYRSNKRVSGQLVVDYCVLGNGLSWYENCEDSNNFKPKQLYTSVSLHVWQKANENFVSDCNIIYAIQNWSAQ